MADKESGASVPVAPGMKDGKIEEIMTDKKG